MAEKKQSKKTPKLVSVPYRNTFVVSLMYFLLFLCIAVVIAVFTWMCASDMLALNNDKFTTEVTLPDSIFSTNPDRGRVADIDYISKELHDKGLIDYEWLFKFYCRISDADIKVDPGDYELSSTYDYRALIQGMREGSAILKTVTVTIPEGFSMYDIFTRLAENKVASYDELMKAAETAQFKYDFLEGNEDLGASRLEGYLFPDTYEFYVHMDPASAINKMLSNFYTRFNQDYVAACAERGRSVKDIITVASYIEKEAKFDDDRTKVAAVVYNRLNAQMNLGLDTTILYVHPEHEGEPDAAMLQEDSPYNTHAGFHAGLTPTPICNPGMASINAALNPEPNCYYYYFYADIETGRLTFFNSGEEFNYYVSNLQNEG